jgi:hypothetical protein
MTDTVSLQFGDHKVYDALKVSLYAHCCQHWSYSSQTLKMAKVKAYELQSKCVYRLAQK